MPVVDYKGYCEMLDNAKANKFAYPAFNITSMSTINAVLEGLAESKSDGIIQVSTGGAQFASGQTKKDMVAGAIALAEFTHRMAEHYDVNVALHTDHCLADKLDSFVKPLIAETEKRREAGLKPLFGSHMFDGSTIDLKENIKISRELLELCAKNDIILEVEAGAVGGEEDGVVADHNASLYTTPQDCIDFAEGLDHYNIGRWMMAATFGNVHGVYKPGNVKLEPKILRDGAKAYEDKYGKGNWFDYVFHGGSGSTEEEIQETLDYGVIKMNVDTDTQYAFTRPVVKHMLENYEGVLKIDGEVGNKKVYDPRAWLKKAETGMKERVIEACNNLRSNNTTIFKKQF